LMAYFHRYRWSTPIAFCTEDAPCGNNMQELEDVGLDITLPGQCSSNSFAASLQIMASISKERAQCGGEVPPMMLTEAVDCPGGTWAKPTYEPLKVCLDDDSSIEEDEDMFDDDAFTFGDEDFEALMSHESMQRLVRAQIPTPSSCGPASPASSGCSALHKKSSSMGLDSLPSTAPSSSASLGNLTLTSVTSFGSASKKSRSKRRVSLHSDVRVISIPSRTDYPSLVKERLWSSATELSKNAARNTLEFAAEGFNWRNVADDAQMLSSSSGERIHPIHAMNIRGVFYKSPSTSPRLGGRTDARENPYPSERPVGMDFEPTR